MILALDVGNTNITVGLIEGETLSRHWRLRTVHDQTADEWGILLRNLLSIGKLKFDNVDALIARMDEDSTRARAALATAPGAFPKLGMIDLI